MTKHAWVKPIIWWIYSAIAVTGVFSGIYLAVQQDYRQIANDPQIQIAEDVAIQLSQGSDIASVVTRNTPLIDIKTSLAPWVAVYDAEGNAINASAQLDNDLPQPPKSLFNDANWKDPKSWATPAGEETRVTWQPEPDVRQAIVLVHFAASGTPTGGPLQSGYVVVGRSLRLTEERIEQLGLNLLLAWLFTLGCLFVASFVGDWILRK